MDELFLRRVRCLMLLSRRRHASSRQAIISASTSPALARSGRKTRRHGNARVFKRLRRRDGGVWKASEEKKVISSTKSGAYNAVPEGSLRKPHGNTLLYCTDIGNCDFAVALYCRVSTTFYDYVSLSTCVKSSSEDRSGSAPLDVVYVRSASHGSTEGRSSPWPPIPKGTYASFSSSPSS